MSYPRIMTIISGAAASAAAFYLMTRSGWAGTVLGAALWSAVYTSISHYFGHGLEGVTEWWRVKKGVSGEGEDGSFDLAPESEAAPTIAMAAGEVAARAQTGVPAAAAEGSRALPRPLMLAQRWAPVGLSVVALALSAALFAWQQPEERLVVTERVVEQPVIKERVIVKTETTTVTVRVPGPLVNPANLAAGTTPTTAVTAVTGQQPVTTEQPPSTTPTTVPSTSSTTPTTTPTTAPAAPPTTLAPETPPAQ